MKKLILVLAILAVASPVFALSVDLVRQGATNKVDITYSAADACNLPRAFALVIDVSGGKADVCEVTNYKQGVSTSTNRGFGIYPATIVIEANGVVDSNGNPIASSGDPLPANADQTLPSNKLVLEFGSLYAPVHDGANSPAVSGTLCTLTVDCNQQTTDPVLTMTGETTYRGGVVLEDGSTFAVSKTLTMTSLCAAAECFSNSDPKYAQWLLQGKPKAWCCLHQRDGDATGDGSVSGSDLIRLKASYGLSFGQVGYDCRADFTHDGAVSGPDLIRLKSNYGTNYGVACQSDWKDDCGPNP
ncbi:MAG: hypothetical protein ABSE89_08935 [Sedimentisphaerales bacterium]